MITCFKFKDMINISYNSTTDMLYLSDNYLQEHSCLENSKDYTIEYVAHTTDNEEDLENNILSAVLKSVNKEGFNYTFGCCFEHFVSRFNQKIGVQNYDWDGFLRVFRKPPLLKFTELIIANSNGIDDEYNVISALYLICKNPNFAELEESGFKFINIVGE